MSKRIFVVRDITVAANDKQRIPIEGDWFTVLSASGEFWLGFDRSDPQPGLEAGLAFPSGGYTDIFIENHTGVELTARVVFSEMAIRDNRLVISGGGISVENFPADQVVSPTVAGTHTPGTDLSILTDTAGLVAAAPTRKEIMLTADGELRLSSVTGKGFIWDGSPLILTTAAQVDFFNDTAGTVKVQFTELLK